MKNTPLRRWILIAVTALLVTGVAVRIIFPAHGGLEKQLPEGSFTAAELFNDFTADPVGAYRLLAGRAIILEDSVSAAGDGFIILGADFKRVRCVFRKTVYDRKPQVAAGKRITIKGICRGQYLTEILVSHCILINK